MALNLESLYINLPIALQNVVLSMEGWRVNEQRYNNSFHKLLASYCDRAMWDSAALAAFRDQRLASFVAHAFDTSPFYRKQQASLLHLASQVRTLDDLQALPILNRETVQRYRQELRSKGELGKTITGHTSGSTGAGLIFPLALISYREQWATWWRYRSWHGIQLQTPCLYFGGRSIVSVDQKRAPYWRYNKPARQIMFSGYHLGEETAVTYLREMQRYSGSWIHGYPSILSLLAGYALDLAVELDVRWVTTGAESLMPYQKDIIEEAFGVRPIEHYGMAEGVANFSQCTEGRLHVDEDFSAVEFDPISDGYYRIIGTNFTNPAFPLIRYDSGDICTLLDGPCSCGLPGRLVDQVDGRNEDFIVTKSGKLLGRLDHILKDCINVREAQIRQERKGQMTMLVVKGPEYSKEDDMRLKREIIRRVGNDVEFDVQYVQQIKRTNRGKLRFVVSELGEAGISLTELLN